LTSSQLFPDATFEVEFRCRFATEEDAFRAVPFLRASLVVSVEWTDSYYGRDVFERGEILRFASILRPDRTRYSLGWKGVDTGAFANVRREIDEDVTMGVSRSRIVAALTGHEGPCSWAEVAPLLESAGYRRFMAYEGRSLVGRHESLGINTKLMHCRTLRWPLLVELEKLAATEAEASRCESELLDVCREYRLEGRLVREEPGTLLYEKVFGRKPPFVS
jgi:hypothetical protein